METHVKKVQQKAAAAAQPKNLILSQQTYCNAKGCWGEKRGKNLHLRIFLHAFFRLLNNHCMPLQFRPYNSIDEKKTNKRIFHKYFSYQFLFTYRE